MDKEEFDRLRLNAIQNALEHEDDPARIADLYTALGSQQLNDIMVRLMQLGFLDERALETAQISFVKSLGLYPNNLSARNHLAALCLIRGDNPSEALVYLEEIPNPIAQCRPEGDRDLIAPIHVEPRLKLSDQDRQKLNEIMKPELQKNPFSIQSFECARLVLRGIALYMSGGSEWEKTIDAAFKEPGAEELFPSVLSIWVMISIKQRLGEDSCQDLRAVLNKYHETSRQRMQRMFDIYKKYRRKDDSETSD
ncbi:hypothetical protein LLG95_05750 [bacterium]|nr:hypothetical protein [bacterium]